MYLVCIILRSCLGSALRLLMHQSVNLHCWVVFFCLTIKALLKKKNIYPSLSVCLAIYLYTYICMFVCAKQLLNESRPF